MDAVFKKKERFMILAKQLDRGDLRAIKPFVSEIHTNIDLYTRTCDDKYLRALLNVLCTCNDLMTRLLLVNHFKTPLHTIDE